MHGTGGGQVWMKTLEERIEQLGSPTWTWGYRYGVFGGGFLERGF